VGGGIIRTFYKIGQLAEMTGVTKRTIDYYTQMGLLQAERSESNYRFYPEESIHKLSLIEKYKQEHMPLEEIKKRLELWETSKEEEVEVLADKVDQISQRMKSLEEELLQLKPLLERLNEKQLQLVTNQISKRGLSFFQAVAIVLGQEPFI